MGMFLEQPRKRDLVVTDENGPAFLSQDLRRCLRECRTSSIHTNMENTED